MATLHDHKSQKQHRVNGWDLVSAGLGLFGGLLLIVSFVQPKNPANMLRLPASFSLFALSVAAERLRESDLLSLDRAIEYEGNIKSERIRRATVIEETMRELQEAEEFFSILPPDRWELAAQRIGIAPPNYAARRPDPVLQQVAQSAPTATQTIECPAPDPTGDFDPEGEDQSSGMLFIPAAKVEEWFQAMGRDCPQSLIDEWAHTPGQGIEVTDGAARIVPKN